MFFEVVISQTKLLLMVCELLVSLSQRVGGSHSQRVGPDLRGPYHSEDKR